MGRTLAEKVWDEHVVRSAPGEPDLLFIDLHLIHEVTSPQAFDGLRLAGRTVRRPDLTLATEDHNVPTLDWDKPIADPVSRTQVDTLRANAEEFGVRLHSLGDVEQGIVHIIGPQLGLTQPGMTIVCGDSHTSTHGAFGSIAFGIGTSEVEHVLATQTLMQARPKTMAVTVNGSLPEGVTAKDLVLTLIAHTGTGGGQGYIVEYRGPAIEELSMEARMTICNMSIEWGAKAGLIAPDQVTFDYLQGRPSAPTGADWDAAVEHWKSLLTDDDATFDEEIVLDASQMTPFVTWGTNPGQGVPLGASVPSPRRLRGRGRQDRGREGPGVHGTRGRHAAARGQGRHGLRGLVHQRPHRGPACCRRGPQGPSGSAGHPPARRAGLGPRPSPGRGRRSRRRLQGGRRRVARSGLLDVPGHEPGPARAGGAQRLHLQPQLRGSAGQGRTHAPRLARSWPPRPPSPARWPRPPTCHRSTPSADPGTGRTDMEKFTRHAGTGLPLRRSNVDTDQIIPAVYLKRVTRTGFEDGLFAAWRKDPQFVINRPEFEGASVLVAGPDFGTGSSREHAVWALMDYGFKAVISSRFADIFRGNSGKAGLVAAQVTQDVVEQLWKLIEHEPSTEIVVDLQERTIQAGALTAPFEIDDYTRWRLLEGLDDIGITLSHDDDIATYESTRPSWKPVTL